MVLLFQKPATLKEHYARNDKLFNAFVLVSVSYKMVAKNFAPTSNLSE